MMTRTPDKQQDTDTGTNSRTRLDNALAELDRIAAESRRILDSGEKYYKDAVMGQIEAYLSNGLNKMKEAEAGDNLPYEKMVDMLKYCDYLKLQYQVFCIRKKILDDDMSIPMPLSNIDDFDMLQNAFEGSDVDLRIGVGLAPKKITLPKEAHAVEWKNSAGFGMTLVQANTGRSLIENAGEIKGKNEKKMVMYKDKDLDSFLASLLMTGNAPNDSRTVHLFSEAVKYDRGKLKNAPDVIIKIRDAGDKADIGAILEILGPKKKIGQLLDELSNLDTDIKARLYYSKQIKSAGLENIPETDFTYMVYSNKAVMERIAVSLLLEEGAPAEYEDMVVHLLMEGSGDQNVKWKAGMILQDNPPQKKGNYEAILAYCAKAFRRHQRDAWYFALNVASKGKYPEINKMLRDLFTGHKIQTEFEPLIINNAENILGPDWREVISSHQSEDSVVQTVISEKLGKKVNLRDGVEFDFDRHLDRIMGAFFGHALGDAMGAPIEMLKLSQIKKLYGVVDGFVAYEYQTLAPGDYTDDTAFTLAGMDSVMEKRQFDPADYSKKLAELSLSMDLGKEPDRHCGSGSMMALRRLTIGQNWMYSGNDTGKNGAAIRMLPLVILDLYDPEKRLRQNVEDASQPTHRDDLAKEGAYITALASRECLLAKEIDAEKFMRALISECRSGALAKKLEQTIGLLKEHHPIEDVQKMLGTTSAVTDTVPYALYCFLKNPYNFKDVITNALNIEGDSDSIAAIAGSLCGGFVGYSKLPAELTEKLFCKDKLKGYFIV